MEENEHIIQKQSLKGSKDQKHIVYEYEYDETGRSGIPEGK